MQITLLIKEVAQKAIKSLYNLEVALDELTLNETKPEFEGDYTLVLFSFVKQLRKSPDALGKEIGEWIVANESSITAFNVIKGFLNLSIADAFWLEFLKHNGQPRYGWQPAKGKKLMVEYASPNTNKPLHLGHLRNIFLGWSVAEICKMNGWEIMKSCIVNDRGIHICKSMLAWQKFANGATPESTGIKGDHFVGDYYVKFENALKEQADPLLDQLMNVDELPVGLDEAVAAKAIALKARLAESTLPTDKRAEIKDELKEIARNQTPIMKEVREMLLKWEQGDEETLKLWNMMNSWVYVGFDETYKRIGADFHKTYYESNTYLLGKEIVDEGLRQKVFFKKPDGSVWIDLSADGLDEKLVLRKDGTSVYITQDLGLAKLKYADFPMNESIYVIADEQNYHMKVLQLTCEKLGMPFADGIHHLSYGMVDLPSGRMKSREGTVVDADDICDEMEKVAAQKTEELGKVQDFTEYELQSLYHTLGMGALKYYLLRVDPKKRMVFNPEDSIDFHGFTGPFIQYTYARIQSVLRKSGLPAGNFSANDNLLPLEKSLLVSLEQFPTVVEQAATQMDPSGIALYIYNLAKSFNSFYTEHKIMNAETEEKKQLRLSISLLTGYVIKSGMHVLGIAVPERM